MIKLSRNLPAALVVGAETFLGGHLVQKLHQQRIQVISESVAALMPGMFPRLDYAVFALSDDLAQEEYILALERFFSLVRQFKPKILLISSLELYDRRKDKPNLKEAEKRLATFAAKEKANARVVRLAPVYGPGMELLADDPLYNLLRAAARGEIRQERVDLDFTTRALYLEDAISLLTKSLFHGGTAHQIYDGALLQPVKLGEVKQILEDPLWHEQTNFEPSKLPPWPSPNLEKTIKQLNWRVQTPLIGGLKATVSYLRSHPEVLKEKSVVSSRYSDSLISEGPAGPVLTSEDSLPEEKSPPRLDVSGVIRPFKRYTPLMAGIALIGLALIYPVVDLALNGYQSYHHLQTAARALSSGQFTQAEREVNLSREVAESLKEGLATQLLWRLLSSTWPEFNRLSQATLLLASGVEASSQTVAGSQGLVLGLAAISGEREGDPAEIFSRAELELTGAINRLGFIQASLAQMKLGQELSQQIHTYRSLLSFGQTLASLVPEMIPRDKGVSYLVVAQDSALLRPNGGVIKSASLLSFDQGRINQIQSFTAGELNKRISERIPPPVEFRANLGGRGWRFEDAGVELGLVDSAATIRSFFEAETESKIDGVVLVDLETLRDLIEVTGAVQTSEGLVNGANLLTKAAGSELVVKESLEEILNRLIFVPQTNWLAIAASLQRGLEGKNLQLYLFNPRLNSTLISAGWASQIPKVSQKPRERETVIILSETNTGSSTGLQLERQFNYSAEVSKEGKVKLQLKVNYQNTAMEQGYQSQLKLLTNLGSKLTEARWGSSSVLDQVSSFSDYSLSGYSLALSVKSKEQKELKFDLESEEAGDGQESNYRFKVLKQPGTGLEKLSFKLSLPQSWKIKSPGGGVVTGNSISWNSDLSQDREFEIQVAK